MDQVNEYKQGSNDRVHRIEKRMENFEQRMTIDMNETREENCKIIEQKTNDTVSSSIASSSIGISENRLDQLERQMRMNELVISGVPYVDNEKVWEIVSSISNVIKFPGGSDSIETCFCLPMQSIVRFWGAEAKSAFFKHFFAAKKLCTSLIGYSATSRIYVNENLTKRNFEIFCMARELKKNGKIVRFTTQRGRVNIKLHGSENSYTIDSLSQLSSLIDTTATVSQMENQLKYNNNNNNSKIILF